MALARIEPQVGRGDFALLTSLVSTLTFVMSLLQAQRTTISRLRRLFGLSSSEKAAHVLDEKERVPPLSKEPGPEPTPPSEGTSSEPTGGTGSTPDPSAPTGTGPKKPKPKGHGRVPASQYQSATHLPVPHPTLQVTVQAWG